MDEQTLKKANEIAQEMKFTEGHLNDWRRVTLKDHIKLQIRGSQYSGDNYVSMRGITDEGFEVLKQGCIANLELSLISMKKDLASL